MNKKELIKNLAKTTTQIEELKTLRTEEDISMAITLMKRNGDLRDSLTDMQKAEVDPLKESIKVITEEYKPHINQAEENEELVKDTLKHTAITLMNKINESAQKETSTASLEIKLAQIPFRQDNTLVITDMTNIPKEYWKLDETKLRKALIDGKEINGAKLEKAITIINK